MASVSRAADRATGAAWPSKKSEVALQMIRQGSRSSLGLTAPVQRRPSKRSESAGAVVGRNCGKMHVGDIAASFQSYGSLLQVERLQAGFPTKSQWATISAALWLPASRHSLRSAASRPPRVIKASRARREELGMTQAAVSYQIKVLEDRVGGPLFLRGARGVTLTDDGRPLAPAVGEAFRAAPGGVRALSETADAILADHRARDLRDELARAEARRLPARSIPEIAVRLDATKRWSISRARISTSAFAAGAAAGRASWRTELFAGRLHTDAEPAPP